MDVVPRVLALRLRLAEVDPAIWRRIEVPDDWTLLKLHDAIQVLMGWYDYHPWRFETKGVKYALPDPDGASSRVRVRPKDPGRTTLSGVLKRPRDRIRYTYDFGDNWVIDVVLEAVLTPEAGVQYPRCVDGERAGPPEDVGGAAAFQEFLEALADRYHERHEEFKDWIGGTWNAGAFDLAAVNAELHSLALAHKHRAR